jgi:hypothetical protein
VGTAPLAGPIPLAAGAHKLEVHADGADTHEETVIVTAGETTRTSVELGGEGGGGFSKRTLGVVLMGVGGAAMAGGAVTGFLAMGANNDLSDCRKNDACNSTKRESSKADDVRSRALMTDILVGSGLAIAGTGVLLYLLGGDETPAATGTTKVGFVPTPGGAAAVGFFEF